MQNVKVVILASGSGSRFDNRKQKQFEKLAGLPIIVHTLKVFEACSRIKGIVVVVQEEYVDQMWDYVSHYGLAKIDKVVVGGATRQASSRIGIECCSRDTDYVLVHDAVRPFVTNQILNTMIDAVLEYKAVDTVIPSADTIVEIDDENFIKNIPDRSYLRRGQTPQAFEYQLILDAHSRASQDQIENATDDCFLVLRLGKKVFTVDGCEQNIKITYPLDLHLADKLFQLKAQTLQVGEDVLPKLKGKVFVIVGGTSGIGQALYNNLKDISSRVYCFSRSTPIPVDVRLPESIQVAVEHVLEREGEIDYVVNCSGDLIRKNVEFTSVDEWQQIYDTNINGNFHLAKVLIPAFKRQNHGSLMFIGSSSYTRGRGGYAAYSSSKAALVNFCQALAEELSPWNIRVNVASPGRVDTPLRFRNFGKEPDSSLLKPDYVAEKIARAMAMETTGSIFEIQ